MHGERPFRYSFVVLCACAVISLYRVEACAQELEPRAYSVSPVNVNFVVWSYIYSSGDLAFDPTLPIENARGQISNTNFAFGRSLGLLGRTSNFTAVLPYTSGTADGLLAGVPTHIYRSGLTDIRFRVAINVVGAPAMNAKEFARREQKTLFGASLAVIAPTGQYDPNKVINIGNNRWAFKPEVGLSQPFAKRWALDVYGGVWLFTDNKNFQGNVRSQAPMVSTQFHLVYNVKRSFWAALDANFYAGGRTSINGIRNYDRQNNSRIGGTVAIPLTRRHSLKAVYSRGAYVNIGGDFQTIGFAWQYLWGGGL